MKKRIRLTEGNLHRIIRGCINEALNELDWRTYTNAAKEAEKRGDKRKEAFLNAATNALNNKFPNRHYNATHYPAGKNTPNAMPAFHEEGCFNPYLNTKYGYMNANLYADNGCFAPHFDYQGEYHKSFGDRGVKGWGKSINNYGFYDKVEEPSSIMNSDDQWEVETHKGSHQGDWHTPTDNEGEWDWNAMSDDMENYYTGKSHYDKNKREWVVDEAISKAIKNVLNENYRRMF